MAVTLTGNGGIFKRFGLLAGALANVKSLMGGTATTDVASGASMQTRGSNIETEALNSPAISAQIDGHWTAISNWRSSQASIFSSFRSYAEATWNYQVQLDAALPSADLTSTTRELIRQMRGSADSINASTTAAGAQTPIGSPTGNMVVVVSMKNKDGYLWQVPFAETLRFAAANDVATGGTARNETISVKGAPAITDKFAYNWPSGSGCSVSVNLIDAQADNAKGNSLTNGDFETFTTTNYPDNWIIQTGAATTDFLRVATPYTQTYALQIVGDGTANAAIAQEFNHAVSTTAGAGGTPFQIKPNKQYAVHFKMRASAAPSAGVLRVALVDSAGTLIADNSATDNSFTVTLSTMTTSYVSVSGTFRTPTVLPTDGIVRLQLKLTTATDAGKSLYIDDMGFAEMTPLYKGGPSVAVFAGSNNVAIGDSWTVAVTNTVGRMAKYLEMLFNLNDKELIVPYSGSPTVGDALIS